MRSTHCGRSRVEEHLKESQHGNPQRTFSSETLRVTVRSCTQYSRMASMRAVVESNTFAQ
jgi:hypothetical protein